MLFNEHPFLERFAAAAAAGFTAVEFLFPYDFPAAEIKARLSAHRLQLVLHNLPAGNWAAGERGIACLPGRVAEFREGVARAISYAQALGVRQLNVLAGLAPAGVDRALLHSTFVENVHYAAREFDRVGLTLLIEAINTKDMPGFFLSTTDQALEVLRDAAAPNVKLQYDIYHMHIMEGQGARTIAAHLPRIGHIQLADFPGRHEPGTGEIDFSMLLAEIDRLGYTGWIGCEYRPKAGTAEGLGWRSRYAEPRRGQPSHLS